MLIVLVSCKKSDPITINEADPTSLNNTALQEGTTLYGEIKDEKGAPIKDVVVSDGFSSVVTDANGVYQIQRHKRAKFVSYSTPSNYKVAVDPQNDPMFYAVLDPMVPKIRQDFALSSQAVEQKFTLLCVADPQCRDLEEVARYKSETIPDINKLATGLNNPYAITLGDIVFDAPELWKEMKASMSNQKVSFFQVIGNHDHLETAASDEKSVENFRQFFGPTDYSFNRGKTHVVAMDNVLYSGKQDYTGGLTDAQLQWLEQDLSHVPKDFMVILAAHIPFRSGGALDHHVKYNEVLALLSQFASAYIMTGHTHYPDKYTHEINGKKIYEYVHGAACGAWWNSTICADGTPNGYGVFEIEDGHIKNEYYKATNYNKDFQIRSYDANQVFGPMNKFTYIFGAPQNLNLPGQGWVVANVWDADDDWTVELFQDGKSKGMMEKVTTRDYWATYYHLEQLGKAVGSTFDKSEKHFFIGQLNGNTSDAHFDIVAKDKFGNEYHSTELTKDFGTAGSY